MQFYFPAEFGERLAFCAAAVAALIGLAALVAPGWTLRLFGLSFGEDGAARRLARSTLAGLYLGLGAAAMLLSQPMVYFAFGIAFAVAAFGGIVAVLSRENAAGRHFIPAIASLLLGLPPLLYVFGLI